MKEILPVLAWCASLLLLTVPASAQVGVCPMCGGMMRGAFGWNGAIPSKLPKPRSKEWLNRLSEVLAREEHSRSQYEADRKKYEAQAPYSMIIPQEQDHIRWLRGLYRAYGITPRPAALPLEATNSLQGALRVGQRIESSLIERYRVLLRGAEDSTTKKVLDTNQFQSRMHERMFTHFLEGGMP